MTGERGKRSRGVTWYVGFFVSLGGVLWRPWAFQNRMMISLTGFYSSWLFSVSWQGLFPDSNTGFHRLNPSFVWGASQVVSAVALYTCCCVSCHLLLGTAPLRMHFHLPANISAPLFASPRLSTTRKCLIGKRRSVCMCMWMHAFVCELESMFSSFCMPVYVCVCMCWTGSHSSLDH